jgi:hypothetical protein
METQEKSLRERLDEEKKANEFVEPNKEKYEGALALLTDRYNKKEGQLNSKNGYTIMLKNKSSKLKIVYEPYGDGSKNCPQINIYTGRHVLNRVDRLWKCTDHTDTHFYSDIGSYRDRIRMEGWGAYRYQNSLEWWEKFLLEEASKVYQEQKQPEQQNDGDAAQNPNVQSTENQKNSLEKLLARDIDLHTKNLYESAMSVLKDSHAKKQGHTNIWGEYRVEKYDRSSQIEIVYNSYEPDDYLYVFTGSGRVLSMDRGNLYAYRPGKWEELLVNDGIFTQSQRKLASIKDPYINRVEDFLDSIDLSDILEAVGAGIGMTFVIGTVLLYLVG